MGDEDFRCDELCTVLSPNGGAWLFAAVEQISYTKYPPFIFCHTSHPLPFPKRGLELEVGCAAGRNGLRQLAEVADAFETRASDPAGMLPPCWGYQGIAGPGEDFWLILASL